MPLIYPAQYESDVVLRDGSTLHLRPVRTGDAPAVLEFLRGLSAESLYFRFFHLPALDLAKAQEVTRVDYDTRFALVGECGDRIGALAGYYRDPTAPGRAEVAFTIADVLQGRGIGTRMLERLADIARDHGIQTFDAYVLGENVKMMQVFLDSGFEVSRRMEGGALHVVLSLKETPAVVARTAARAQEAATASMKPFFEPKVIAVVGANRERGRIGAEIFHNLRAGAFRGLVIPVNPNAAAIDGAPVFPRVADIPGPVDLAVIAVPAAAVPEVVADCIAKGVKAVVVISAGFGESDAEGRRREAALLDTIRAAGIRMIGPNCMGVINTDPDVRLNATFSPVDPPEGRVAMSTQSGALGIAILDYARRFNLGISTFVSVGNKADVSGNDLIQYWAEDPRTDVILLYLESFGNPRRFAQIARRVAREKPIVAVKAGRSRAGMRAALSHTGALAASDVIVEALFRQAGVIRTQTLEELFDVATLLAHQPMPRGSRVAILTNAGGPGILASDACEANALELPALGEATITELRRLLPPAASVSNPVDMLASATPDDYRRATRLLLADERVDSLLVIFIPPLVTDPDAVADAIVEGAASARGKPVLATFMRAQGAPPSLAPIPCYPFPESAAIALARVTTYAAWRQRPTGSVPAFAEVQPGAGRAVVDAVLARGGGWLARAEAEHLLATFGIRVARSHIATTEVDAAVAAWAIGFPVALKAVGPAILHKTEVGGVKLGISDEGGVRVAVRDLQTRLAGVLTGVLVQEMVVGGVEMLVGALYDPTFGPLITCGSGGTLTELLADVAFRLQPLTDLDAAAMIEELKGAPLLRGHRGGPPADEAALRDALLRVSALLETCPEIHEMDINPLIVLPRGVCAVDVRIRVDRRPVPPVSRRIMY